MTPKVFTAKNIRRFYGKITGNQLPVHFPFFLTGARKYFQESGSKKICIACGHIALEPYKGIFECCQLQADA